MGIKFSKSVDQDGDDEALSPITNSRSLLGTERGTDATRRLETDDNNSLYVNVASSPATTPNSVNAIAGGVITSIPASTPTTITTYSAASDIKVTRIGCSGTCYAKYQLVLNTVIIETKRSGPERSIDFIFERPLNLSTSDVLDIKVTHFVIGGLEDFEATIYGG